MKNMKYIIPVFLMFAMTLFTVQAGEVYKTEIKGTVLVSSNEQPLVGAQVIIPGVASAFTDDDGQFLITSSVDGAIMVVSAPGYATRHVPVGSKKEFRITLMDESFKGSYEDIALPYTIKNSLNSAYAVSSHENREDHKLGATNLESVFQVGLNGMNTVSRTGLPGAGSNMFLNGINSLNTTTQPLIIVDGVEYDNSLYYSLVGGNNLSPLSYIDVRDVDQVTVLKSGTSLYGAKAANGVILINTIQAKGVATRINFHAYTGLNLEPATQYRMMNGLNYRNYLSDMLYSKGMSVSEVQALPYINNEVPVVENWGVSGNSDYYRYNQSTDWQDEVFNSSFNQNYYLNITGGNDAALYAISFGYMGHGGTVGKTNFERYNTRVNAKIEMTEWFKLNASMSFVYTQRNLSFEGLNKAFNPVYAGLVKAPFAAPYVYNVIGEETPNLENSDVFGISNPTVITQNSLTANNSFRFFGMLNGIFTFNKYMNLSVLAGITTDKLAERIFFPGAGVYHEALPGGEVTNVSQQLRSQLLQFNTDARINYNRIFDYDHNLAVRAGFRYQHSDAEVDWGKAYNTSSDEMKTLGDGLNTLAQVGGSLGLWGHVSNYLNVEYGYQNRYFVALNAALDGSSRFGSEADGLKIGNNVFGLFPSVNAAWILSSEDFMQSQSLFDVLKVRAGYTIAGNHEIGNYSARYYYVPQNLLGASGLVRANVPNTKLKWETNKKLNVGVDASFMGERVNVSLDLYRSVTEDLINVSQLSSISGVGTSVSNDGTLENIGADLSVTVRAIDRQNLKWDIGMNLSSYQNKLLSISDNNRITQFAGANVITSIGGPVAQFYGYEYEGVFSTQAEADAAGLFIKNAYGDMMQFNAGDARFKDQNNDNLIDENDRVVIGNPNPDFFGSINNRVSFGRYTLSAVLGFSVGNDVYNALRSNLESMTGTDNQTQAAVARWKREGQVTDVPKATWGDPMANARFSDRWIENASYLRLRSLTASYELPMKSNVISSAQIYITVNNLLTFTKYLGYDPEFSISQSPLYMGIDTGITAQPMSVLLGVKIGL